MANSYFQFKHFTVWHDRCAMKVGTDGVLLGAWAHLDKKTQRILDVGSGTGLIALILAQRSCPDTQITALEIDKDAAEQAKENIERSPWANKIEVVCTDFNQYETESRFDLIVSNPPYFRNALTCPDAQRATARHADTLSYECLISQSASLLTSEGKLALIIPAETWEHTKLTAIGHGLYPEEVVRVSTIDGLKPKRILACFSKTPETCQYKDFAIESADRKYTAEYRQLVQDLYLNL